MTNTMKMSRQPKWDAGNEPDRLTQIVGGFYDHQGAAFLVPVGLAGRTVGASKIDGRWTWVIDAATSEHSE